MANHKEIIGFCGRLQSGKSLLANICSEYGYTRLYFAMPLKKLICSLLCISIDELNKMKTANFEFTFKDMDSQLIANETKIPLAVVKDKLNGKTFHNTRELMQVIGTDLIREYNVNWHVNQIRQMIQDCESDKIVIDDVRFQNEYDLINELGGTMWFIARPNNLSVSHHASEETLTWDMFDNVIVNNIPLQYLVFNWKLFLENGYENSLTKRKEFIERIKNNESIKKDVIKSDEKFNILDMLFISQDELTYENTYKDISFEENLSYEDLHRLVPMFNGLMIEDLKKWIK